MLRYSAKAVLSADVNSVFAYLADFSKRNEWASGEIDDAPAGPVEVGSTFTELGGGGWGVDPWTKMQVTKVVPNERIVWQEVGRLVRRRGFVEVQRLGAGTRVRSGAEVVIDPRGVNVYFLLMGLAVGWLNLGAWLLEWPYNRWQEGRAVRRLRARLES